MDHHPLLYVQASRLDRLNIREWGMPTGARHGRMWKRSNGRGGWIVARMVVRATTKPGFVDIDWYDVIIVNLKGSETRGIDDWEWDPHAVPRRS